MAGKILDPLPPKDGIKPNKRLRDTVSEPSSQGGTTTFTYYYDGTGTSSSSPPRVM